jgi:hypothetical protein
VPDEPVPLVTVEVLSEVNRTTVGRDLLEGKRRLIGAIGVPLHVEVDPDEGVITTWVCRQGQLSLASVTDRYVGDALGGVVIETPSPGMVRVLTPGGREVLDVADEIHRADTEAARADAEAARAQRLADRLRLLGVEPDRPSAIPIMATVRDDDDLDIRT